MGRGLDPRNVGHRGPMDRDEIEQYLRLVGHHLFEQSLAGEILIVGGAYMTLVDCG